MKTLLIPIDFSATALQALPYAADFAQKLDAKIVLFHAHPVAEHYVEAPAYMIVERTNAIKELAMRRLAKIQGRIHAINPEIYCESVVAQGPFLRELREYMVENTVDWIIMGTKGARGLQKLLSGTQTAKVIGKTSCPVLAIPPESLFEGIKEILYATNFEDENEGILRQLSELAGLFNARVNILHISTTRDAADNQIFDWYRNVIEEFIPTQKISFHTIWNRNVEEGIQEMVEKLAPDMLIMSTHKRSWKELLLEGSHTQTMVFETHVPLLALHTDAYAEEEVTA